MPRNEKELAKITVWLTKEEKKQLENFIIDSNENNMTAYIKEAIKFYGGYVKSKDNQYLPIALTTALESICKLSEDRISKLLFKNTVELSMMMNLIAYSVDISDNDLLKLRKQCINLVKQSVGKINFEDVRKNNI